MATLSDSRPPRHRDGEALVDEVVELCGQAVGLAAEHERDGTGEVGLVVGRAAADDGRHPAHPCAPPRRSSTATASPPLATGRWNRAPAEARTHFGLHGSTEAPQKSTAEAPAASAGPQQGARVAGIGHVDEHEGQRARRGRCDRRVQVDLGPGGDGRDPLRRGGVDATWPARRRPRCGPGRRGAAARSTTSSKPAPAATRTSSTTRPDCSASATRRGPSMTNAPSSGRAARRLERRRSRCTLGWRDPIGPRVGQALSLAEAAPAAWTSAVKASGSRTARSARTLRSTSISARRSPEMNRL